MRNILLLICSLLSLNTFATHLTGGYISYRSLGGTTYEITLTLYRDCNSTTPFDGSPGTNAAAIGIYRSNTTNLVTTLLLSEPTVTDIKGDTTAFCHLPPSVCRQKGVYLDTVVLPSTTYAYDLIYERCCLPTDINNITNAGDQGSVFSATIPVQPTPNNSPVVNLVLENYIRIYDTVRMTNWCIDPDGDDLSYAFADANSGGSPAAPAPNPPVGPPYTTVPWASGFSAIKPFGMASTTSINSSFGQILIVPQAIGKFMVNIVVTERRNNVPLSEYPILLNFTVSDCQGDTTGVVIPVDTNTTGVTNLENENGISLYPNPTAHSSTISGVPMYVHQACLLDMNGRTLQQVDIVDGMASFINLNTYSAGIYFVQAGSYTKRLVIQAE